MTLISSNIPNLLNGVSQQAPQLRRNSQCEVQENAVSSPALGLVKRPPAEFVKDLSASPDNPPFTYFIDRSQDEQYLVVMDGRDISVFNSDGDAQTVEYAEHTDVIFAREDSLNAISTPFRIWQPTPHPQLNWDYNIEASVHSFDLILERSSTGQFGGEEVTEGTVSASTTAVSGTFAITLSETQEGNFLRIRSTHTNSSNASVVVSSAFRHQATTYIVTDNQRDDLKALTLGDSTFLVNTGVETRALPDVLAFNPELISATNPLPSYLTYQEPMRNREVMLFLRSIPAASPLQPLTLHFEFPLVVGSGNSFNVIPGFNGNPPSFAYSILNTLNGTTAVTNHLVITQDGPVVHARRKDGPGYLNPFVLRPLNADGDGVIVITDTIERYGDLPIRAPHGYIVEITGGADSASDNYFVRFVGDDEGAASFSEGYWEETADPSLVQCFDPGSMPHLLERRDDGVFEYRRAVWNDRMAGSEETNPFPSFTGQPINNIFTYSDRLGFLSGSNVIMTEFTEAFNFFRTTALTLLDTAPIDVQVSGQSGGGALSSPTLIHAATHNEDLLLFTNRNQFVLSGGDILSPQSVSVRLSTQFEAGTLAAPAPVGKDLYFSADSGEFSAVREYFRDGNSNTNNAADVTAHIPYYIPKNVRNIAPDPSGDNLWVVSEEAPDTLFNYSFLWQADQKIQSSWSSWVFGGATILNMGVFSGDLFILADYADRGRVLLLKVDLHQVLNGESGDIPVLLDLRVDEEQATAVALGFTQSLISPPYALKDGATYVITNRKVEDSDDPTGTVSHTVVAEDGVTLSVLNNELIVPGNHWEDLGTTYYFGEAYTMTYEFSPFVLKIPRRDQEISVAGDKVSIRTFLLDYVDTGQFNMEITPGHTGQTSVHPVGPQVDDAGSPVLLSGTIRRNVLSPPANTKVAITSDSHLPCSILSADWEAEHQQRSRKV